MLSVKERNRTFPHYRFHKLLIKKLWPELLNIPINPKSIQYILKKNFRSNVLNNDFIYPLAKRLKKYIHH